MERLILAAIVTLLLNLFVGGESPSRVQNTSDSDFSGSQPSMIQKM
ncbi:hypothetical protein JJD41_14585 [Oxynema sp. CENA135]|nr:hypothetical protein [Oxynema sp. CENA135]MBK4731077.1 hypothetical protein [Oxynema sp. CENA135]